MDLDLREKVALIAGGTVGIGLAVARRPLLGATKGKCASFLRENY